MREVLGEWVRGMCDDEGQWYGLAWHGMAHTETCGEDVFIPRILAYRQVIVKAERTGAVCAGEFMV